MNVAPSKHLRALIFGLASFVLASSMAVVAHAQTGVSPIASFSVAETGNDTRIWTTVQDAEGALYFGADGLVRFDGSRWQTTPLEGAYALRALDFGRDGKLWAAADRDLGSYTRTAEGGWSFHSLRENLPFPLNELGEMWHVFAEPEGALFVSENKILRWDGKKFHVWPLTGARRLPSVRAGGNIYVHHLPTGLYVMESSGPRLVVPRSVLEDAAVIWLEPHAGGMLLATSKGLFNYSNAQLEPCGKEASAFIARESLTSAARMPNGQLALGTFRGGIAFVRTDGSIERILNQSNGLPTPAIFSLFVDREGLLWATSPYSIFSVPTDPATTLFTSTSGLPAQPILKVVRQDGRTIVATENGTYEMGDDDSRFQPFANVRDWVWDMQPSHDGLLIARKRSVAVLTRDAVKVIHSSQFDAYLAKPSRRTPGRILVSEGRSIVAIDANGQSRTLVENLPDIATSIAEDSRGQLWLGTFAAGILVAQPAADHPVEAAAPAPAAGLPRLRGLGTVIANPSGTLLALAPEGGWILGEKSSRFQRIDHYPARKVSVYSYVSADESVWVVHPEANGLPAAAARIAIHGDRATWQPHSVDGLWDIGAPRCLFAEISPTTGATNLWIGGTKGLLRNEVAHGPVAPIPHPPLLRAYSRTEASAFQSISGGLPYATKSVRFEFAAPEFSRRPALRLETFIAGIDHDWVAADATASRELTAVRDGSYTFQVRAVAETGRVSEPAAFHFEILPPWWRTTPAIAGVLLALAPGAYGVYRLRIRSLRRHNAELEEKVGQRTAQLAKASAAKTEFVANMSHDIRNPLNGIVGLALALEDTRLDPRQREIVATLRECSTYLSSLVDDVLDFASIEAGQVELRPGPFAPAELLRSVATTLKGDAAEQGATILIEIDSKLPPTLLGDAGRIQQILVNYASNAVKYAGGTIRLIAHTIAPGEIEFVVADEGPGLTEVETAALFTKFTRLPSARNESIKGAGLGLAACRSLADIMGGSVGVESQHGAGSQFFLRLPLVVSKPPESAPGFALPAARVLIVEDADYNAWAAAAVLAKLGLPNERATTGEEALRLFAEKRFDVVLLDRNLPDMDGTEVAKRLRELEAEGNSRAILLAVTAYCTAEDRALCLAAGMDAFVGKPLTPEKLRRVLLAAGRRLLAAASVHVSPETPAAAPIDFSLLNYISDGTEEGLGEQIDRFLGTLAKAEDQLEHAASARDFSGVAASAHQVTGQAKMVGAFALEAASVSLETAARSGDVNAFGSLFEQVRQETGTLKGALRRHHSPTHLG